MTDAQKGALALLASYTIWGLSSIYYKALDDVPSLEVLAHRTLWSFVLFGLYIAVQGRLRELYALLRPSSGWNGIGLVALAALFISINWYLFIDTVASGRALEASLGYYIFPLVSIIIGLVLFGERLRGWQYASVALVAIAVTVLAVGLGAPPYRALGMACSFALYGAIKKRLVAGPILSVTGEVALLVPLAAIWLVGAEFAGWGASATQHAGAFGSSWGISLALMFAGLITGLPLIFFAYASRRVTLISVGLGQYYNSTIQLFLAVFLFAEPFTPYHAVAMPLVWFGLALHLWQVWRDERQARSARRARSSAAISGTSV